MRDPSRTALALATAFGLASCSFAPKYERPAAPIAASFGTAATTTGAPAAERGWREVFGEPQLQRVIGLALANNRDLRVAMLNVELARAQYQIQRSELFPTVSGQASYTRNRVGGLTGQGGINGNFYNVGLGASYELDLFGRIRSLKAQALEEYFATEAARQTAHLSLVAEVASQYLRIRAFEEQRVIAEQTLATVREFATITERLVEAGQRSDLDARTAEAQVQSARAEIARLARVKAQAFNTLVLLVGQPLPELGAATPLDAQPIVDDLPAGLPSDLLQRRPDILAAEHLLKAANANIGAARAAFFPTISLTGFAGLVSTSLAGLVTGGAAIWTVAPQLSVPIFTGGRNAANLDVAKVRKQIEIARYERAIQVAFREVADVLVARETFDQQLEAQTARASAEQARFTISETRYRSGVESYLAVITAQQDLYVTQQQLIDLRLARLINLVQLYRVLGGGWLERSAPPAAATAR